MKNKRYGSLIFTGVVLLFLSVIVFVQVSVAHGHALEKEKQLLEVTNQITKEKERNLDLKEKLEYADSEEFLIQIAREEFGLIQENEIIFIPVE